jgi:hypothetical protein
LTKGRTTHRLSVPSRPRFHRYHTVAHLLPLREHCRLGYPKQPSRVVLVDKFLRPPAAAAAAVAVVGVVVAAISPEAQIFVGYLIANDAVLFAGAVLGVEQRDKSSSKPAPEDIVEDLETEREYRTNWDRRS